MLDPREPRVFVHLFAFWLAAARLGFQPFGKDASHNAPHGLLGGKRGPHDLAGLLYVKGKRELGDDVTP
jgi:hypothetical protein